jgi:hypothetical protein
MEMARLKTACLRLLENAYYNFLEPFPMVEKAMLDFRPTVSTWGHWSPEERAIILCEDLLRQDRWEPMKGVLGHETAHQIAQELYPLSTRNETSHGPTFMRICRKIGLDPFYTRATIPSDGFGVRPPRPAGPDVEDGELKPVLERVKKLLALAGSENENEAALALSAAERILARHSLGREDVERGVAPGDEPYRRVSLPLKGQRSGLRHSLIASLIKDFFGVSAVFSWNYDPSTGKEAKEIELFGRPMNLAMGEHVWHFLNERCETLWAAYRPTAWQLGEKGVGAKNAFMHGLLRAFTRKMEEGRRRSAEPGAGAGPGGRAAEVALYARENEALDEYIGRVYPRLRSTRHSSSASVRSPNAAGAGAAAGRELTIHRPVGGSGGRPAGPAGRIGN